LSYSYRNYNELTVLAFSDPLFSEAPYSDNGYDVEIAQIIGL
jgi:hypothetical protein